MVELVDTQHLKCCSLVGVRVRFPLRVLKYGPFSAYCQWQVMLELVFIDILCMYYVYALASVNRNYIYVGITENVAARVARHQGGRERTTKPYRPYLLIFSEACSDRAAAREREKSLKSSGGKRRLRELRRQAFIEAALVLPL